MENIDVESQDNRVEWDKKQIRDKLDTYDPFLSSKSSIYKVPDNLRTLNMAAYTPQVVSIGPIHHKSNAYQTMEIHKAGYLQAFLSRTATSLDDFIVYVVEQEPRVRRCYAETVWDDNFRSMVLLDGIFIIELFIMAWDSRSELGETHGETLHQPVNIESDLKLLENQLPFFLLKGLYNLAFPSISEDNDLPSFLHLACSYFHHHNFNMDPESEVEHFTDLLRAIHLPSIKSQPRPVSKLKSHLSKILSRRHGHGQGQYRSREEAQWSKSATVLREAGVKFSVGLSKRLCDIEFDDGVLKIPKFTFQSGTESFIRNLMALEQCHYPYNTYICDYFFFLDNLINTAKDVDILVENGIIINRLGDSDAVANLINKLPKNVLVFNFGVYDQVCKELNEHCDFRWHAWVVSLKHDYLSNPWKFASTIAAVILLVLTFIQTVCSIVSVSV